jgi:hypothetical protein
MNKSDLPASIRRFIEEQETCPVSDLSKVPKSTIRSPFSSYWYRAIAGMMLSGRVQPKRYDDDGAPNMTDVNRIGKEANFNQYLFERVARTLATADIVVEGKFGGPYQEGPNIDAFWEHDEAKLPEIGRQAVLSYMKRHAGYLPKRATPIAGAHLIEFLTLFFACFRGRAVVESKLVAVLQGFSRLPEDDLMRLARELGLKASAVKPDAWSYWAGLKDGRVLTDALGTAEWIYGEERNRVFWVFPGAVGLWMLGLDEPLPPYELSHTLESGPKQTIRAGTGLSRQTLVPLFRHCKIRKISEVCEFQLDRKRMAQAPAGTSPGEELRQALKDLEPFPAAIAEALGTGSQLGGEIVIHGCSALVKPENAQVLEAIRRHPSLKNYIEPGGPPGYLLIKPSSEPYNFIERCRNLGFKVTMEGAMPLDRRPMWLPKPGSW